VIDTATTFTIQSLAPALSKECATESRTRGDLVVVSTHESTRRRGCTTLIAMTFTRRQFCQFVGLRTDDIARNSGGVFTRRSEMTRSVNRMIRLQTLLSIASSRGVKDV
jgi:hypothetical protein